MKKRRILVSLALASAALFSLAACGKTESTPTPTPAPTSAAPAPATSTAPAASSTPAASSSTPAAEKVTVKYIAKYSDGAADEELTALATQIDKNTKATAPAENPTKDGYVFKGFRNKTTHLPFDFDANITKNTDIVAYFYKPGTYDEIAASDDVVMAYDFDDAELGAKIPAYDANITGLCNSNGVDDETYGATVVVKDYHNMLKTYDLGGSQTKVLFNIKDAIENSKVTIYAKFKLDGTMGSSWPFIEVLTKDGTEEKAAYGFGGDANKKLGYRIGNGGYQNYKNELLEADKEYNALFEVDTDAKTIKLTLNGEAFDPVSADFDNVTGIRFVTGGGAGTYTGHSDERFIIIDQFAVKAEANDITTIKAGAKAAVKDVYDAYVESDQADELVAGEWDDVETAYNAAYTETTGTIDAATTAADVKTAKTAAITAIETAVKNLRNAKVEEINTLLAANDTTNPTTPAGTWFWTNGDAASDKYLDKYNAADNTKKAEFVTALNALKTTYRAEVVELKNIKEGYTLLGEFEVEANAIVLPKVDVTVKYYKYQYTEATGITAWAADTKYYEETAGQYVVVDQTAVTAPAADIKYFTREIVSAGSDATYKSNKDEKTTAGSVPTLAGYFTVGYYTDATLGTAFDFVNTSLSGNTTMYVEVTKEIKATFGALTTGNFDDAARGTKLMFSEHIAYCITTDQVDGGTDSKDKVVATNPAFFIDNVKITKFIQTAGKSQAKNNNPVCQFEIDLSTVSGNVKISIYAGNTGTKNGEQSTGVGNRDVLITSKPNINSKTDTSVLAQANCSVVYDSSIDTVTCNTTVAGGTDQKYYICATNGVRMYMVKLEMVD